MFPRALWLLAVAVVSACASPGPDDPALQRIRTLLMPMRAKPFEGGERGARPASTEVKHELKAWIEGRMRDLQKQEEARAVARELNEALLRAGLSCRTGVPREQGCPDRPGPGYLGEIKIDLGELLVVTTAVGIVCGEDESAYAYSRVDGRWTLIWQNETNDYRKGKYVPLNFLSIRPSYRDYLDKRADANTRLLLVLARDPAYCESNWYNAYHRVWRLRMDRLEPELLLDEGELAFLSAPVDGIVEPKEVLVEYSTRFTFTDFNLRRIVRHYVMKDGKFERVPPFALCPRDFADEWMRTAWKISSQWTSDGVPPAWLQREHRGDNFAGGIYGRTTHCEQRPEHWQVALDVSGKGPADPATNWYFLVRWLPPYRFTMSGVSNRPWSGCTEEDPQADEDRTLFPIHRDGGLD